MPTKLIRINLDELAPFFVTPLLEVLAECSAKGKDYYAYSGNRSWGKQGALFAQGRTRQFDDQGKPLKIITNAQPGFSLHNYGLAVDCALDKDLVTPGLQPEWGNSKGEYNLLKEVGEKWGFQVGVPSVPGGDPGHIQIPIRKIYAVPEAKVMGDWRRLVRNKGEKEALQILWAEIAQVWPLDKRPKRQP